MMDNKKCNQLVTMPKDTVELLSSKEGGAVEWDPKTKGSHTDFL